MEYIDTYRHYLQTYVIIVENQNCEHFLNFINTHLVGLKGELNVTHSKDNTLFWLTLSQDELVILKLGTNYKSIHINIMYDITEN
jgi:hypothetical protein